MCTSTTPVVEVTYTLDGIHLVVHHHRPPKATTVMIDPLWYVGTRSRREKNTMEVAA